VREVCRSEQGLGHGVRPPVGGPCVPIGGVPTQD
jgi:hypothetical protein